MISNKDNVVLRQDKNVPLTHQEGDQNFIELKNVIDDVEQLDQKVPDEPIQYVGGLVVSSKNQTYVYDGEYWKAAASVELPFTTTNWGADDFKFVSVGDAVLRGELNIIPRTYTTVAEMKADTTLTSGTPVNTLGYYTSGDGGQARYLIQTSAEFGYTPDEYGDHTLANGNVAVLQVEGAVSVRRFGARGDGYTDDFIPIYSAMDYAYSRDLHLYFPSGYYRLSSTIPFKVSMFGDGVNSTRIGTIAPFTGDMLLDNYAPGFRKCIKHIRFSSSLDDVQIIGSSFNGQGSSIVLCESVWFTNTPDGVYAVGGSSSVAAPGMLTGWVFLKCVWDSCNQWVNAGLNQDDVSFIGCRFNGDGANNNPSNYVLELRGQNIGFHGCYFRIARGGKNVSSLKMPILIGSGNVCFKNSFMEGNNQTDITNIFYVADPTACFNIENLTLRFQQADTLQSVIRSQAFSGESNKNIVVNCVKKSDSREYTLIDYFVQSGSLGKCFLEFSGITDFSGGLYSIASGSVTGRESLILKGQYNGVQYNHAAVSGSSELRPLDVAQTLQNIRILSGQSSSPSNFTYQLLGEGVWMVNVTAQINGSRDHSISGTFIVNYANPAFNKILITEQLGAIKKSFGSAFQLGDLTVSDPDESGNLEIVCAWGNGNSYAVRYVISAQKVGMI